MGQKSPKRASLVTENRIRSAAANFDGLNEETRSVRLSFASEEPVVYPWGEKEILRCSDEAVDTKRLGIMPVLFNHNRDYVIGRTEKIWLEGGKAYADIQFDDDDSSRQIMAKVKSGSLRGVSVGYRIREYRVVKPGETDADGVQGPAVIATRWEVFEISVVSVPADPTVGVGRSFFEDNGNDERSIDNMFDDENKNKQGEGNMPNADGQRQGTIEGNAPDGQRQGASAANAATGTKQANDTEERAEHERCLQIINLCERMGIANQQRDKWLTERTDMNTVNAEALAILSARRAPQATANYRVTEAEEDKKRAARRDAYAMRCGISIEKPAPGAESLRGMSMMDMAREMLAERGVPGVWRMPAEELLQRAMTTSALPTLLSDVTQLSLVRGYEEADTTYQLWVRKGSLKDFRATHRVRVGMDAEPVLIPENGEFTDAEMQESKSAVKLATYGRSYTYTREAFINDDHNILAEIPRQLGNATKTMINRMAYKALMGGSFTDKVNLAGTKGAPSSATMADMMKLLRTRKDDLTGRVLRIMPKYMLVPVALEFAAKQFLNSTADPASNNSGVANVYKNAVTLISDPELDAVSADAWYLLGNPVMGEGVEVSFLNGVETPTLRSFVSQDTLGWKYQMYFDFGVKLMSTVGYVKNEGKE